MLVFDFERTLWYLNQQHATNPFSAVIDAKPVPQIKHHDTYLEEHAKNDAELDKHLLGYLKALQAAGHHVLFLAPEFDEDEFRSPIRFSLTSENPPELNDIAGFTAPMINRYLALLWYTSAHVAQQRKGLGHTMWDQTTCLSGYHSWLFPGHEAEWHSSFIISQPPRATILCGREVVLYFTLSQIAFYYSADYPEGFTVK